MLECFREYFRILKPGKWMTVEFSNTSAAVWNGIQTAIQQAGFVIANVSSLDKQQGSFKAVTTSTAVKQDLVISCYKPSKEFVERFTSGNIETSIWDFIDSHLDISSTSDNQ
jgi:adenylate kinase family enzyme